MTANIKALIRKERLALRDAIPVEDRATKSLELVEHGKAALIFAPGAIISGFLPIRSEADVRPLMEWLRKHGARLCVPVILDKETIVFREWAENALLIAGSFGTLQPGPEAEVLQPEILLVPLSAFDRNGQRIGYGAGHYDRAIAKLRQKGLARRLIGIAFDCQEVPSVPAEPHDVPLDAILTESGLLVISPEIG